MCAPSQNYEPQLDFGSDEVVNNELYNIHLHPQHNEKKDAEDFELYSTKPSYVCKFYNPYFRNGCQYGRCCQFRHLTESSFLKYCGYSSKHHPVDSSAEKTFGKALDHIENDRIRQGYLLLRNLVLEHELNGQFNFWLGRCHSLFPNPTNDDMQIAQFYYRKAIAISPSNSSFHAYYAQFSTEWAKKLKLKVRCSEYKQAKDHFRKSLKLRSIPMVHFHFAKFLDEIEGQHYEAIYHYTTAIKTLDYNTRIRLNYARCLHKIKRHSLAKKEFLTIFNIYKHKDWQCPIWPHFHYAKLLIDMQYYQQAHEELQHCIDCMNKVNNKFFSEIYYTMAKLQCSYLCQYKSAHYYINIAIELSPFRKYYTKLLQQIQQNIQQQNEREKYWEQNQNQNQNHNHNQKQNEEEEKNTLSPPSKGFDFGRLCDDDEDDDEDKEEKYNSCYNNNITKNTFLFGKMTTINEESEHDDDAENEFLANRFCATEFDRVISSDISFGDEFEKYVDKFEDEKMNDIRMLLKKEVLDEKWLKNKIGMNIKSMQIWKKNVIMFRDNYYEYILWLKKHNFYHKYFKKFETYGILHLQSFFYHIKNQDDVLHMIGLRNKHDAQLIWKYAQKEKQQMLKSVVN